MDQVSNLKNLSSAMKFSLVCMVCSSCNNNHESETEQIIRTEFAKNYQAAAAKNNANQLYIVKLEKLAKNNPDSYRSIAYTWQNAAIKACQVNANSAEQEQPRSSYELLLQEKQAKGYQSFQTDKLTRPCVQNFYTTNLSKINTMIEFSN